MAPKEKVVIFTGSGVSQESGIETYRSDTGLWHRHSIREVCHTDGWRQNPKRVLGFWNDRRKEMMDAKPNIAHEAIASLEQRYDVTVVTQNVDDLHRQAGSSNVLHLHGEITMARSDSEGLCYLYDIGYQDIRIGDKCEGGFQLRPHICFFNENPFFLDEAAQAIKECDKILIAGTSLQVQPASSLVRLAHRAKEVVVVDPERPNLLINHHYIEGTATQRIPDLIGKWLTQ